MNLDNSSKYHINNNNIEKSTIINKKVIEKGNKVIESQPEIVNFDELFNDIKGFDVTPNDLISVREVNDKINTDIEEIEFL